MSAHPGCNQHKHAPGCGHPGATGGPAESEVALEVGVPAAASRADLLAEPELRHIPDAWLAEKTDAELAEALAEMRASRAALDAELAEQRAADEAERARRRSYRRPDWLTLETDAFGVHRYRTADGYSGHEVETVADGRVSTSYAVRAPRGSDSAEVSRVEEMADWIVAHRAERAQTWAEAFPLVSPAARLGAFRGKPTQTWFDETAQGEASYIGADGSYVGVHLDHDPTGNWFVGGEFADGTYFNGGPHGSRAEAKARAEQVLADGVGAYRREQER